MNVNKNSKKMYFYTLYNCNYMIIYDILNEYLL